MSDTEKYRLKKSEIEKLEIPRGNSKVLIKITEQAADETTPSGLLVVGDTDWQPAAHATRTGVVVKAPKDPLPFKVKSDNMPWRTKIQISSGMKVWFDFLEGENCLSYYDEDGYEYKLIDYSNLYVATTPRKEGEEIDGLQRSSDGTEWIIPLNGFSLFERVYKKKTSKFDISDPKVDRRKGIVKYVAENNLEYESGQETDHIRLKPGDEVVFNSVPEVMLEDDMHRKFDGGRMYRRAQARNVDLAWRDGELILPDGRCLVRRIPDESHTPSGIILPKPNVKNHTSEIIVSTVQEAPAGKIIKHVKGAGIDLEYKGEALRLLREEQILYVE